MAKEHREHTPTIASVVAVGLRQYLRELGLDANSILQRAELKPETFKDRYSRIPVQQFAVALEISARQTDNPYFGLHFGEWYTPPILHACNYAISCAPDLHNALASLQDHRNLVANMATQLSEPGAYSELSWTIEQLSLSPRHVIDFKAMRTIKHIQQATGPNWVSPRVRLAYEKPKDISEYVRLLGPNIEYSQPMNSFVVASDVLALRMPDANPDIFYMARNSFRNPFPYKLDDNSPVEELQQFISQRLEKNVATLAGASQHMGMSPQKLRRLLKKHGTCFQSTLNDTRKAHASHYLHHTNIRLSEIAFLLGFSDQSAFSRAVKRWFGVPPKDVRKIESD